VCEKLGIKPTPCHKNAVKAMLKKARGVESLGDLDSAGMSLFIERSAMLLASEFAMVVDFPGEYGVEEMDMRNFLKLYLDGTATETTNQDRTTENEVHDKEMGDH